MKYQFLIWTLVWTYISSKPVERIPPESLSEAFGMYDTVRGTGGSDSTSIPMSKEMPMNHEACSRGSIQPSMYNTNFGNKFARSPRITQEEDHSQLYRHSLELNHERSPTADFESRRRYWSPLESSELRNPSRYTYPEKRPYGQGIFTDQSPEEFRESYLRYHGTGTEAHRHGVSINPRPQEATSVSSEERQRRKDKLKEVLKKC